MFKCCFALYSELFSCLDYFSLFTGEKLALTCSKAEVICEIPAATRALSNSPYHCCHERVRCGTQGISDQCLKFGCSAPRRIPPRPHCSNRLKPSFFPPKIACHQCNALLILGPTFNQQSVLLSIFHQRVFSAV